MLQCLGHRDQVSLVGLGVELESRLGWTYEIAWHGQLKQLEDVVSSGLLIARMWNFIVDPT